MTDRALSLPDPAAVAAIQARAIRYRRLARVNTDQRTIEVLTALALEDEARAAAIAARPRAAAGLPLHCGIAHVAEAGDVAG